MTLRSVIRASALALWLVAPFSMSVTAQAAEPPASFADLLEKLQPAVVNVSTTQKIKSNPLPMPFMEVPPGEMPEEFREFFDHFGRQFGGGKPQEREVTSLGSGFVVDASGFIVTNNHVIADADKIQVIFNDNTKLDAKIIGRDKKTDLALLKVEAKKPLPFVGFGDSDAARVGDWVICVGNPFGLGGTVTAGIISARARNINAGPFDDFLQTDAAINRGNSGGPMFNVKGEVIGINTAIFSPSGGSVGIGFAVPSSLAKPVVDQLRQFGRTHRGWLGVKIQEVTEEIADSVGLETPKGALVLEITPESPAAKAGVEAGDIIISFDGKPVDAMRHLPRMVAETKIGKKVTLTVWRKGKTRDYSFTLGELDETEKAAADGDEEGGGAQSAKGRQVMGMTLARLSDALREEYRLPKEFRGVVIVDLDPASGAARRGFRPGDVISQVGERSIKDVKDVSDAFDSVRKSKRKFALVRVLRRGEVLFVTLPVEVEK